MQLTTLPAEDGNELDDLENLAEMPIEELRARFAAGTEPTWDEDEEEEEEEEEDDEEDDEEGEEEAEEAGAEAEE